MVMFWIQRLALAAVAVAGGMAAGQRFGVAGGLAAGALAAAASAGLGVALLARSAVGEVTWRNRLAGWLLPFGGLFGATTLGGLALTAGGLLAGFAASGAAARGDGYLAAAWALDFVVVANLAAIALRHSPGSSSRRSVLVQTAAVGALGLGSVAFAAAGRPALAAAVAAGPILALAALYGLFVLLMVTVGRNARWN